MIMLKTNGQLARGVKRVRVPTPNLGSNLHQRVRDAAAVEADGAHSALLVLLARAPSRSAAELIHDRRHAGGRAPHRRELGAHGSGKILQPGPDYHSTI